MTTIMKNDLQLELLAAWEETYKKGQLTMWVFLSLSEGRKYVDEIQAFVVGRSNGTMTCEEQSLYRSLRKYQYLGMVDYEAGKGDRGPERKYYFLTPLGKNLLTQFIDRNIALFFRPDIRQLLNINMEERL